MQQPENSATGFFSRKAKSLYTELTIALVLLVSVVSAGANLGYYLYFSHQAETTDEGRSAEYSSYLRESLEWPLWNIDDELIARIGSAFASNAEIASLIIRDDQQRVVFKHEKPNGSQIRHTVVIEHRGQHIGSAEIGLSQDIYAERDRQLLLASIATVVLLIAVLLGATRWILARMLKKPVDAYIAATKVMVDGKYQQIELPETYQEFNPILSSFKAMSDVVASRENSLRQSNMRLEAEIVERNRARDAARTSEARFRKLVKVVSIPLCYVTKGGVIEDFNDRFAQVFGYTHEEIPTLKEWWKLAYPDEAYRQWAIDTWAEAVQVSMATGQDIRPVAYRVACKNGEYRIMEISGVTLGDGFLATFVDLTARLQEEEELRRSEHGLAEAQRIAHLGNWELDLVNNVLIWSDEIYRIFEIDREKFGASYEAFLNAIHPEDRERVNKAYVESVSNKVPYEIEHRLLMADGRIKYVSEKCETYYGEDGKPMSSVGTVHDITDRKLAEEALRVSQERLDLAILAGNIGVWDWDIVNNVLTWGDNMYALYGIRKEDFGGAYEAWSCMLHPEDRAYVEGEIQAALRGEREYAPEFRIQHPDGSVHVFKAASRTYFDQQGKPLRMVGTNIDITQQKDTEEALRHYKDHLEEQVQQRTADLVLARNAAETANRAKSVFLASMSHELRTPLNAILGFSNMMRKDPQLQPEQRQNLDIINRSGEHLLTLINDVLEMSKIEAGKVQVEKEAFDLGGLVRDVSDMMHVRAQEKGLQLLVEQSSDVPRYIKSDEARLRQVLINLVGNAVKFTQQGGITMRFGVKPNAELERLLIEVEDTGIGIKPEDQQKIFEAFVQLGDDAMQKGTGLGLTLTRQYVQLMDGSISVDSMPGKGSIFKVELPLEKVEATEVASHEALVARDVVGLAPNQPKYRVLIVEDQLENQLLLAKLMKNIDLQVEVAVNGEQAVALYQSFHPHLIWMDRRMPVMDGLEATRQIRALPGGKEVKIVAVTASAFTEQRDEMLKVGMDDFVRKPYRFNEIYECLGRQLGVEYLYADTQAAEDVAGVQLTPEMLAGLPETLRHELREALESLEGERIMAVIQNVAEIDPVLHGALSHLAENYDYPTILKVL